MRHWPRSSDQANYPLIDSFFNENDSTEELKASAAALLIK
jgi:hypothetical protein